MKKLLVFLVTLIIILLIALGVVLAFPEIEDWVFPSSQAGSSQAVQAANKSRTPDPGTRTSPRDMEDNGGATNPRGDALENNRSSQPYIVEVTAGRRETCVLYSDGSLKVLTDNDIIVSGPSPVISVSCGMFHTVGLRSDGTAFASITTYENVDVDVGQCNVRGWTDIVAVSAGFLHTVGLRSDGTVVAASSNEAGECNVGNWSDIIAVSAGFNHTVGLRADGTVVATGGNRYGQCSVNHWTDIVAISAGYYCTIGVRSDGTVVATGENEMGQCNVNGWSDIIDVDTSFIGVTVGLRSDGTVVATEFPPDIKGFAWDKGQNNVSDWTDIVAISVGHDHTVGLCADGTVVAVGDNRNGQCNVSALSNSMTGNSSNGAGNDLTNRYEGSGFEDFLSQLQYPTGPFSLAGRYSTLQIESVSIVEIEESSKDECVNITFEIIGTVWNSDMLSLNVDCFDAEGYNIDSTMITCQVSDGNRFKIRDEALQIPLETVRIEFSTD